MAVSSVPSPSNYITCYIYNMITDEKIQFETIPDGVNENYGASWSSNEVLGRSAPYYAFSGNESRTVDYSVKLFRDILGDNYLPVINMCKRLVYPNYASSAIVTPPYCYVRFGGMVHMFAMVNSVSVSWGDTIIADDDTDPNENVYSTAEISFSFTELIMSGQKLPTASALNYLNKDY